MIKNGVNRVAADVSDIKAVAAATFRPPGIRCPNLGHLGNVLESKFI